MRKTGRLHKPEFKAMAALTAIEGELTMAGMARKYDGQASQIMQWKKQLLASAGAAFDKDNQIADEREHEAPELRAKVRQFVLEHEFLERGLERIHGPTGASAGGKQW